MTYDKLDKALKRLEELRSDLRAAEIVLETYPGKGWAGEGRRTAEERINLCRNAFYEEADL
jgi:hypothetical protein